MKVITAVRLHPSEGYPLAVEWIDVADDKKADWNLAAPRHRVSAQAVFNELKDGAQVSSVFPDGAQGFIAGQDIEPVEYGGIATFKLARPKLPGRTLKDLEQFS